MQLICYSLIQKTSISNHRWREREPDKPAIEGSVKPAQNILYDQGCLTAYDELKCCHRTDLEACERVECISFIQLLSHFCTGP